MAWFFFLGGGGASTDCTLLFCRRLGDATVPVAPEKVTTTETAACFS